MVKWCNGEMNPKWWYSDIVISCDSIFLGQTYNTTRFLSFYEHLENIRGCDTPDNHALKTQLESLTEELIQDLVHPKTSPFFYRGSHLSELQSCAVIFLTNSYFIFTFK